MIESMWLHYIILITIYFLYNLPHFLEQYSLEDAKLGPCSVLILVISARDHYDNRQAIRKTWVEASHRLRNVCYTFAIGRECMVPHDDRIDYYGCQELMDHTADLTSSDKFISNSYHDKEFGMQQQIYYEGYPWYTAIGFKILSPVILKSVGIYTKVFLSHGSLVIRLRNAKSKVFNIKITKDSCSTIEEGYCYQPLKGEDIFEMAKDYEAEILIIGQTNIDYRAPYLDCKWVNASVIHYTFGKVNDAIEPFDSLRCSLLTLIFQVKDSESLRSHFLTKSSRRQSYDMLISKTNLTIANEIKVDKDIIYLPHVMDVYRNLPVKLMQSLIWIKRHYYKFDFVLKVDDDSYLNVNRINNLITNLPSNHSPAIFGGFSHNGVINQFGKWAEVEYPSMIYPPFPTGAGYLLTESLVSLLVDASPFLKPFQGEDVSVAIWVDGLTGTYKNPSWYRVNKREIKCWLSLPKCPNFYIKQQLTPLLMYKLHYNL